MHSPRRLLSALILALFALVAFSPPAQVPVIDISAEAGFNGSFRDGAWLPVFIRISNQGDAATGRLVVRPETSGVGITNTYSTPVDLPSGAAQNITLYVTANSFATQLRVDVLDEAGVVIASAPASLRVAQPLDRVIVTVSQSTAGVVDLTSATFGTNSAYQSNRTIDSLPARAAGWEAVDVLLFSDVDTSGISSDQRTAIAQWVAAGGHLIVTGGSAWESTAAGLADLLPLQPEDVTTVSSLASLAAWLRDDAPLEAQTLVATGELLPDAQVLVEVDELPLLVRRAYGAGTVDYLAVDPNTAPLRGWPALTELWLALQTTVDVQPGWTAGISDWSLASQAVEILPGYSLLPNILPLCGFLGLYIALIGPINYFVLARLNRRELAWFTIPLFIIVFSVLAYALGFNLRGTDVVFSRLGLVRVWPEVPIAPVEGLVGLLSPRRAQYDLGLGGGLLRPIPRNTQGGLLTGAVQSSINIRQTDAFTAESFAVDASFIAGFSAETETPAPTISGSASISKNPETGQDVVRGLVRNESELTLVAPVVVARGFAFTFDTSLAPGESLDFDFSLPNAQIPSPLILPAQGSGISRSPFAPSLLGSRTVNDLLGTNTPLRNQRLPQEDEEQRRRRLFLASLVNDYVITSSLTATGRGNHVFFAGWNSESPLPLLLDGAPWTSTDATLYLVDLNVDVIHPTGITSVTPEQFTWINESDNLLGERTPLNLSLQPGEQATFRFTPLPSAVLTEVDELVVHMDRASIGLAAIPVDLFNWETDAWETVDAGQGETRISDPQRFLGPQNTVRLRLTSGDVGGFLRVEQLLVEQRGTF
jgi:hypothetical protein